MCWGIDEARYLFIRLYLRQDKWIRLASLDYQSDITDLSAACAALFRVLPDLAPETQAEDIKDNRSPSPKKQDEVLDLTMSDDEEDIDLTKTSDAEDNKTTDKKPSGSKEKGKQIVEEIVANFTRMNRTISVASLLDRQSL